MDATKRVTANLTPKQYELLCKLAEADGYKSLSAYLKWLIQNEAEFKYHEWPEDQNTWGDPVRFKVEEIPD